MGNLDISHLQATKPLLTAPVIIKLWGKDKADGGWVLVYEVKSLEVGEIPKTYTHGASFFKLQERDFLDNGDCILSYTQIKAVNNCSKCHVRVKAQPSFPPQPFDHWCDRCYALTPLAQRTRKCSRAQMRKLLEKQQQAADKKAELRAAILVEQELKRAVVARNKPVCTPSRKVKKNADVALSLDLNFTESAVECEPLVEALDYDVLRQRSAEVQDPSVFDEELPDD